MESTIGTTRLKIGVIYQPPRQTVSALEQFAHHLEHTLNLITTKRDNTILLLGDFTAKCTDWLPGTSTNAAGTILSNILASFDLHQMVSEVTRRSGGKSLPSVHGDGTLLDLINTNRPAFFGAPSILPALGLSDHFTAQCTFDACTPNQRRPLVRL